MNKLIDCQRDLKLWLMFFVTITFLNKSAKWHCGRHTLICKKILVKKT